MTTQTQITPLAAAERDLEAAKAEVARIEQENAPIENEFGRLHEMLENATATGGSGSPEARKAAAGIAAIAKVVKVGRQRLEVFQRRVSIAAERVESAKAGEAVARHAVADQRQRVSRQAEALGVTRRKAAEQQQALEAEERRLVDLRRDLAVLIGEDV